MASNLQWGVVDSWWPYLKISFDVEEMSLLLPLYGVLMLFIGERAMRFKFDVLVLLTLMLSFFDDEFKIVIELSYLIISTMLSALTVLAKSHILS